MCAEEMARLETELGRAQLFTTLSKDGSRDLCSRGAAQQVALHPHKPVPHVWQLVLFENEWNVLFLYNRENRKRNNKILYNIYNLLLLYFRNPYPLFQKHKIF